MLTGSLLSVSMHLKFFDSSRPRASFIGTDSCQGLHFSPSCIVRESLRGEAEVIASRDLVSVFSYSVKARVTNTPRHFTEDQIPEAHFSLLAPVSPAHMAT